MPSLHDDLIVHIPATFHREILWLLEELVISWI